MPITTIKVSTETRDRLKTHAQAAGMTLGDYLDELVFLADRRARFTAMREAIARSSPEDFASYREEIAWWDRLSDDALDD